VKRLRKSLADAGHHQITTHPNGYLLAVEPGGLDLARFEDLLAAARAAAGQEEWQAAAAQARDAGALWRGEPLARRRRTAARPLPAGHRLSG
jgi:hypothetical protein